MFVTGANRGIGLEFVRQLVTLPKPPKFIFATYRSRDGIQALKTIRDSVKTTQVLLLKMDVSKKNEVEAARKITEDMVGDKGLTLLINNAAVLAGQVFPQITEENLLYHFKTNTIGPIVVIQEFLPLLKKAADLHGQASRMEVSRAAVLNISALLGSNVHLKEIIEVSGCFAPGYSISKAGLNMSGRIIAACVKDQGILVVNMCPGWVKTDMGSDRADLEVNESVSAMMNTLPKLDETHHGQFMDRDGKLYEY